jgi:hypothetical protein
MRKKLLTMSVLAEIPRWISEHGLSVAEIADKIGCTVGSLRVRCSHFGISLRQSSRSRQPRHAGPARNPALREMVLNLPDVTRVRLQERAALLGLSDAQLASALIETIVRDDLYSAVLDDSR